MHVLHLLLQIGAIILVGRLLARVMRRLGQPTVIAEILAGIVLGKSVLGAVAPGAMDALFPAETLPLLGMTSQLGLVFFMFLVGLEFDPALLDGRARTSLAISSTGIVVSLTLGGALSVALFEDYAPAGVSPLAFGLFMGAAMSVTAFPVLARILAERQLMRTPLGVVVLAAAAMDDVTAWCLLAFTVAVASASGLSGAFVTTSLAGVYVLAMLGIVRPMLTRIVPRGDQPPSRELVAGVFLVVLASAALTEWIGVHPLFGAFVAGAIMPRHGSLVPALEARLEDFVTIVLLPLFFAYSGLRTRIGLLDTPGEWALTAGIIAVATLGKFGGTAFAARLTGLGRRDAAAVGVLMNTRGLMELVVLNIGLDLGVLTPQLFAMMVIMALVTTWVTTPALARILPTAALQGHATTHAVAPAAPPPLPLVCIADAGVAPSMLALSRALAPTGVRALHLRPTARFSETMHPDTAESDPLDAARDHALARGVPVELLSFASSNPAEDIARIAAETAAPFVLLGAHRSAFAGDSMGGNVARVLQRTGCDVLVLVDRGLIQVRRVRVVLGAATGTAEARALHLLAGRLRANAIDVHETSDAGDAGDGVDLVLAPQAIMPPAGGTCSWVTVCAAAPSA